MCDIGMAEVPVAKLQGPENPTQNDDLASLNIIIQLRFVYRGVRANVSLLCLDTTQNAQQWIVDNTRKIFA